MRQNADGTWSIELRGTWTAPTREALVAARIFTGQTDSGACRVNIWDITETPLPIEMPEPMPGMIMEYEAAWGKARVAVTLSSMEEDGSWVIEAPENRERRWSPNGILRIWSPTHVPLWQRPTPTSEEK